MENKGGAYVAQFQKDMDRSEKTYKGHSVTIVAIPNVLESFVNNIKKNINTRFQQVDMLQAFGVLGMRPISMLGRRELEDWGADMIQMMGNHFGEEKSHTWKDENGELQSKVAPPVVDKEALLPEWSLLKRVVIAQMYPRDRMSELWKLIIVHHKEEFPNLIKLAVLALTCAVHTADCERSFSVQNYITTQRRAALSSEKCDMLMRVVILGKKLEEFDFANAVKIWSEAKHRMLFTNKKKTPLGNDTD